MTATSLLKSAPQKLYLQIADLIRAEIREKQWAPGTRLPAIDAQARQYGVAVITVRQAIALLEKEGLLRREHGRGTFVDENLKQRNIWLRMDSSWNTLVRKWEGIKPRLLTVKNRVSCPAIPDLPGKPAAAYRNMKRVHVAEGLPYALVDVFLAQDIYDRAPKRFDTERILSVLDTLQRIRIVHASETLTIGSADVETARNLKIPLNAPVGTVRRMLVDQHGTLIYFANVTYRGDVVRIERVLDR